MIPKSHHRQYYSLAEEQRARCPERMMNVLDIVYKVIKSQVSCQTHHYYYQRMLTSIGMPCGYDSDCIYREYVSEVHMEYVDNSFIEDKKDKSKRWSTLLFGKKLIGGKNE